MIYELEKAKILLKLATNGLSTDTRLVNEACSIFLQYLNIFFQRCKIYEIVLKMHTLVSFVVDLICGRFWRMVSWKWVRQYLNVAEQLFKFWVAQSYDDFNIGSSLLVTPSLLRQFLLENNTEYLTEVAHEFLPGNCHFPKVDEGIEIWTYLRQVIRDIYNLRIWNLDWQGQDLLYKLIHQRLIFWLVHLEIMNILMQYNDLIVGADFALQIL